MGAASVSPAKTKPKTATAGNARRRKIAREDSHNHYSERRKTLYAAAATLFREKGYKDTTLEDIAQLANLNRSSIYYYAENKKQIFFEMVLEAMVSVVEEIRRINDMESDPRKRLEIFLSAMMDNYERNFPYMFVFLQEHLTEAFAAGTPQAKKLIDLAQEVDRMLFELLRAGRETAVFRTDIPINISAFAVFGMVNWTHRWFRPGGKYTGKQLAALFSTLLLDGLLEREAQPQLALQSPAAGSRGRRRGQK